jgi:hypothetical protein
MVVHRKENGMSEVTVIEQWAGWCREGSSDKCWSAALLSDHRVVTEWGRRGSMVQGGSPQQCGSEEEARALYIRVVGGKAGTPQRPGKYVTCGFDAAPTFVPTYAGRYGTVASADAVPGAPVLTRPQTAIREVSVARVLPLTDAEFRTTIDNPGWGITEKVNGHRCVARIDGGVVKTYNRRGGATPSVPTALHRLHGCSRSFVLDGERLDGDNAGAYVAFDLLECDGEDYRGRPCRERLAAMRRLLADLDVQHTASHRLDTAEPSGDRLVALFPVTEGKAAVVECLRAAGAEGVILRDLDAPYTDGDSRAIRKRKFVSDIDCIVVGANDGAAGGSLRLALRRPRDNALIAVGNVRSGLGQADIAAIRARLCDGELPVIRVSFLPARTVGVTLVEPTAAGADVRDDKVARECVTDQLLDLVPERASVIAAAPAIGVLL